MNKPEIKEYSLEKYPTLNHIWDLLSEEEIGYLEEFLYKDQMYQAEVVGTRIYIEGGLEQRDVKFTRLDKINESKFKAGDEIEILQFYHDEGSAEEYFGVEPQVSWHVVELYVELKKYKLYERDGVLGFNKSLTNCESVIFEKGFKFVSLDEYEEVVRDEFEYYARNYPKEIDLATYDDYELDNTFLLYLKMCKVNPAGTADRLEAEKLEAKRQHKLDAEEYKKNGGYVDEEGRIYPI